MQSHAVSCTAKAKGQSHKGEDSEFGTLRAWVGTAHSSGGGDAHTDFKLEDTGRFCPTVTSVVTSFGPTEVVPWYYLGGQGSISCKLEK